MTLSALCLHFLKHLNSEKEAVSAGYIKSIMLGYGNISADDVLEELANRQYMTIDVTCKPSNLYHSMIKIGAHDF